MAESLGNNGLYIEDIAHKCLINSVEIISEIMSEIEKAQKVKISFFRFVWKFRRYSKELDELNKKYITLYKNFRDKYILDPNQKEEFKVGKAFDLGKDTYSYLLSALPTAMRDNIKNDPKIINPSLVEVSLLAHSISYENLLKRIESLLNTLNNTISNKRIEYNNVTASYINLTMLILVALTVILTLLKVLKWP